LSSRQAILPGKQTQKACHAHESLNPKHYRHESLNPKGKRAPTRARAQEQGRAHHVHERINSVKRLRFQARHLINPTKTTDFLQLSLSLFLSLSLSLSLTHKRRCTYRPSVIYFIVNKLLSLSLSRATRPNGEWGYSTRCQCWATSAQRRCHPEEALYLPTFSHLFDCQ
jgi:hypothetical protein